MSSETNHTTKQDNYIVDANELNKLNCTYSTSEKSKPQVFSPQNILETSISPSQDVLLTSEQQNHLRVVEKKSWKNRHNQYGSKTSSRHSDHSSRSFSREKTSQSFPLSSLSTIIKSKPKGKTALHWDISHLSLSLYPSKEDALTRKKATAMVIDYLSHYFQSGADEDVSVSLIGSSATGLYLPGSDIDLVIRRNTMLDQQKEDKLLHALHLFSEDPIQFSTVRFMNDR